MAATVINLNAPERKISDIDWAAFAPATGVADDNEYEIDMSDAETGFFVFNTKDAANVSDDVEVLAYGSADGANWSDSPIASIALVDDDSGHIYLGRGIKFVRFRANNNHATDNAAIKGQAYILRKPIMR